MFKLRENGSNVKTEVLAGFTTFITMAYIIFVNPSILRLAGMNAANALGAGAADFNAFNDPIVGAVMVATCLAAAAGTLVMAFYANCPYAQAPGMGLNALFAYTVVLDMGYTWQQGLAIVFLSGIFSIIITVSKIRIAIVDAIPDSMKNAVSAGIGLFIAFIGFANAGIIVSNPATMVGFGNFAAPPTLLAIIGLFITGILLARNVKGAMLIGIFATTLIGIPMGVVTIPQGFAPFSAPPSLAPTFMQMDFPGLMKATGATDFWSILIAIVTLIISFSFVDIFDTIGTLVGTGTKAGMLDENGKVIRIDKALISDSVATSVGAIFGTSNTTTYVESAAGVMVGGRTGLTALVVAILFLACLFIAPLAGLVPSAATAPALIIVGVMMMGAVKEIDFEDFSEAIPAFLTIIMMPLSYGIANGIAVGFIAYPVMKLAVGKGKQVHPIIYILAVLFALRFFTLAG
ncbi:MAG TPA: NCS2 family permease [Clostridia bacterium]|nr:NCS2 family permease [Clostridia bacterium]